MDHSKHIPLRYDQLNSSDVEGISVYGTDDSQISDVSHFSGTDQIAQVVLNVGGFLGVGSKRVSLPLSSLTFMQDENGNIHATTVLTEDELKDLPALSD